MGLSVKSSTTLIFKCFIVYNTLLLRPLHTYYLCSIPPSQCFREECTSSSCMTTIRPLVWFCFGYAFGNVLPSDGYLVNVYKVKAQLIKVILYCTLCYYYILDASLKKDFYLLIYFDNKVLDLCIK